MKRTLPPLNALRAFESAARNVSVSLAAAELGVSPAAISHQIRLFEDFIGLPVLERSGRGIALTDAGRAALLPIQAGFAQFHNAMDAIDALGETGTLNVSVAPSFAAKWLLPRLRDFEALYPQIDVNVSASVQLVDFTRDSVDIAIRYGGGSYPELHAERLLSESVYAVCSPALLKNGRPLKSLADLAGQTLLHDDSPDNDPSCPGWDHWLRAAGRTEIDFTRGPRFNQASLVLEAAILGRGIALAKSTLAEADIKAGRLVRLFSTEVPVTFAYYVVAPKSKLNLPKVSFFRDWLRSQVESSGAEKPPVYKAEFNHVAA
ncbi:transcriptional regulator GcvA [Aestuariivirga litoralis]|uniref:transcriptional regulator GcvA n=1 Tax=Aestuariivirga litoralis TaxID=2650924 RepID=UPI0018C838BC|nr:transcriptional regulator GcvA [Aestuariivirga litoralis]MBG1232520.1 transcriptional regulator GcvA [Aestuariivirga litoralis]